jgi:hypothetical protein
MDSLTLKDIPPILRETEDKVIGVDEGPEFFTLYVRKGNSTTARNLSGSQRYLKQI